MKLSKIALTYCPCGFSGSLAFLAADGFKADCPQCGKQVVPHERRAAVTDANRRFSGSQQISFAQGMHPKEVPLARKLMPKSAAAGCFLPDGRVKFKDSKTEQTYRKELDRAMQATGSVRDAAGMREYQRR